MVIHVADTAGNMTIGLPSHARARVGGDAQMLASSMGTEGNVDDGAAGAGCRAPPDDKSRQVFPIFSLFDFSFCSMQATSLDGDRSD
jgi:hypothetical protein